MTHKNRKKQGNFMFIFEGLKGSHDVLFVGLGISKLQMYTWHKIWIFGVHT
jgi:hypothetical protein